MPLYLAWAWPSFVSLARCPSRQAREAESPPSMASSIVRVVGSRDQSCAIQINSSHVDGVGVPDAARNPLLAVGVHMPDHRVISPGKCRWDSTKPPYLCKSALTWHVCFGQE
jgi:hypothetical protein